MIMAALVLVAFGITPLPRMDEPSPLPDRLNLLVATAGMIVAHPVTGIGFGNFDLYQEQFFLRPKVLTELSTTTREGFWAGGTHNTLLTPAAELGVIAGGLYVILALAQTLGAAWRRPRAATYHSVLESGLPVCAFLVGLTFLVNGAFVELRFSPTANALMWLFVGMAQRQRLASTANAEPSNGHRSPFRAAACAGVAPNHADAASAAPVSGPMAPGKLSVALVGAYPGDPAVIRNGVEAVVVYLAAALQRIEKLTVHVVSADDRIGRAQPVRRGAAVVHYVRPGRRFRNITSDALTKRRMRQKIAALSPDIVHVHNHMASPYVDSCLAPYPTIISVHGLVYEEMKYEGGGFSRVRRLARTRLERRVLRNACEVIAVSEYVKSALEALTDANIAVLENPVADAFFEVGKLRDQRGTSGRPKRILFAGAISRLKNIIGLLDAFARVTPDYPDAQLRIAGGVQDQEYYAESLRHAERSRAGRGQFAGWVS